jgi:hypothetical protein
MRKENPTKYLVDMRGFRNRYNVTVRGIAGLSAF